MPGAHIVDPQRGIRCARVDICCKVNYEIRLGRRFVADSVTIEVTFDDADARALDSGDRRQLFRC